MAVPFALGKVIDVIYGLDQMKNKENESAIDTSKKNLDKLCKALMVVFIIGGVANFGRVYYMRIAAQNITARLRNQVFSSIVRQETAFFDKTKTGELINRLSADTQLVSQAVTQQVTDGLRSSLMTTAGIGMMFFMSPQLAMVGIICLYFYCKSFVKKTIKKIVSFIHFIGEFRNCTSSCFLGCLDGSKGQKNQQRCSRCIGTINSYC